MHEPKEYGRKVQHQFIYAAMPRCNYNVLDAYNTYYKNALVSPCLKTLRAWWRNFQDNRELLVDTVARVRDERQRERKPARKDAMPDEVVERIRIMLRDQPWLYHHEVVEKLRAQGHEYSLAAVGRAIHIRLNWSRHKIMTRAKQRDWVLINDYIDCVRCIHDPNMFIFVDEASKGKEEERRTMGYGPKGEPLEVDAWYDTHSRNYTLIAAATLQEGFFKPACEVVGRNHGSNDSDPTHGSVDADRFVLWVREQLVPHLGNAVACEARSVVVMDNATIHHDPRVKELIEAAGARLIYLPPYSPFLNPIELCFREYKTFLRSAYGKGIPVHMAHVGALQCVNFEKMCGFLRKCGCYSNVPRPMTPHERSVAALMLILSLYNF